MHERSFRRRRQPGARVQGRRRIAAVHRPRVRVAAAGRRRQPVHRLRDVVGAAHPRARAARSGAARWRRRRGRAPASARRARSKSQLGERVRALMPSIERVRFVSSGTEAAMSAVRVARAATGRDAHHEIRRLLPRPRRRVSGEGRIRRADARDADEPRRHARGVRRHRSSPTTTISIRCSRVFEREPRSHRRAHRRADRRQHGRGAAGGRVPARAAGHLHARRARCSSSTRSSPDFAPRPGGAQGADRRASRSHLPRQDHRRRAAGWRVRRTRRPDGSRVAGRTRVSGRHAVGQPAGDDRGPVVSRSPHAEAVPTLAALGAPARRRPRRRGTRRRRPAAGQRVRIAPDAVLHERAGARLSHPPRAPTPIAMRRSSGGC